MRTYEQLMELYHEAWDDVYDTGIEPGAVRELKTSSRMTKSLGACHRGKDFTVHGETAYTIKVSERLLNESVPDDFVKNVLIHELIHTVDGCFNHGPKFKAHAAEINRAYPQYHISRCESSESVAAYGIEYVPVGTVKYIFKCKNCGQIIRRRKRTKFVENYQNYRCGKCGGRLEKIEREMDQGIFFSEEEVWT